MEKTIRNSILLVVLIVVLAGAIYIFLSSQNLPGQEQNQERSGQEGNETGESVREVNFAERGNLIRNNPGMDPDIWYLVYEQPGQPALYVKLVFDNDSVCIFNPSGQEGCDSLNEEAIGKHVSVEGFREGDTVLVAELSEL